jgi:hypothetical protein
MLANLASFTVFCASASAADADPAVGEVPLTDVLAIVVAQRTLLAIDALGGGQTSEKLRLTEEVLWTGSRGRVGIAITDQRILGATTESGRWSETELHRVESAPEEVLLGERVALMVTDERIIGLNGGSGNLVETNLGLRESVLARRIGENVATVVTNLRALGLSPFAGGFSSISLGLKERVESVNANANVATVVTDRRILIYRSPTGSWEERRLNLK